MGNRRIVALVLAAMIIVFIVFAATQSRVDPIWIDNNWQGVPIPPCFVDAAKCYGHILGTDEVGRDILARLTYGGMLGLVVALIAVVVEVVLGVGIAVSARRGGPIVRFVVQRFEAALSCFPPWAFVLAMIAIGTPERFPGLSVFVLALLVGLVFSPRIARVASSMRDARGLLPALLDRAAYDLTRIVVLFATIDFFGLGVQPPTPSWGGMISDWPENISIAWWAPVFPAISLFGAVLVIEILRRLLFDRVTSSASNSGPSLV